MNPLQELSEETLNWLSLALSEDSGRPILEGFNWVSIDGQGYAMATDSYSAYATPITTSWEGPISRDGQPIETTGSFDEPAKLLTEILSNRNEGPPIEIPTAFLEETANSLDRLDPWHMFFPLFTEHGEPAPNLYTKNPMSASWTDGQWTTAKDSKIMGTHPENPDPPLENKADFDLDRLLATGAPTLREQPPVVHAINVPYTFDYTTNGVNRVGAIMPVRSIHLHK